MAVALLCFALPRFAHAVDTSVTVIELEAKGVDITVAAVATDELETAIEASGIPVASNDSLKAELKRRGLSQTCGVDDCPVPFEKILKSTHLLRGSVLQLGSTRILKVTLETVKPRKPIFSGRREFDTVDTSLLAAVKDLGRDVVECLEGKDCKDSASANDVPKWEETSQVNETKSAAVSNGPSASLPSTDTEMVTIPAGNFLYGDDKRSIYLPAFRIDKTEVTISAYNKCMETKNCLSFSTINSCTSKIPGKHPVTCVRWSEAKDYCEWLGKRLPTEQEWEKAARGTDGRTYPWGEQEPTCDLAIMKGNGDFGCGKDSTWPVCSKPKGISPYGLCDMAGNVLEWTSSRHEPTGGRVVRGGSWGDGERSSGNLRAAFRDGYPGYIAESKFGFRCAQDVK